MNSRFVLVKDDTLFFNKDSRQWVESGLATIWKSYDELLTDINALIFENKFNSDHTMHIKEVGFIYGKSGGMLCDCIGKGKDRVLVDSALSKLNKAEIDALVKEFRRTHSVNAE